MKLLQDIAEIRTGYPFRERPVRVSGNGCGLVQMGDLDTITGWIKADLERVDFPTGWENHRLRIGDVLLASRGERNDAAQFGGDFEAVAAAHLLVIRLKPNCGMHPFFLTWFLNQSNTQGRLRAVRSGTNIPFLPIEGLKPLEIPVPSDELQHHMVRLHHLSLEEDRLVQQIQEKRRKLMTGVFQSLLTTAESH